MIYNLSEKNPEPKQIGKDACDFFFKNGYLNLSSVFTTKELGYIDSMCNSVIASDSYPTEHLPDGFYSWRAVTINSTELAALACDSRLLSIAIQLLGTSIKLVGSQLINKHPFFGERKCGIPERTGWHTDIYHMYEDIGSLAPPCAIKFIIWFSNDHTNGLEPAPTKFVAESNRKGIPTIKNGQIDPINFITPNARSGDVTIFENRTAHAGSFNTSDKIGKMLIFQYGYRWLSHVTELRHSEEILSKCSPLNRQILEPNDIDRSGVYSPGIGNMVIENWANNNNINRLFSPTIHIDNYIKYNNINS